MSADGAKATTVVGIEHIQLAVPPGGEDACRAFYLEVLGLPEIPHPMTAAGRSFLWVQLGAQQVHFRPDPDFKAAQFAHPGILVRGVDALAARLKAAGYAVTTEQSIAADRFHVRDPFGNRLEFIEAK
jgi:catechol 2,3-dioxygenase-like lactoylglutathione lyase family enzyme